MTKLKAELEKLELMDLEDLKLMYSEYFNNKPQGRSKEYFVNIIGYRMQELQLGGISKETRNVLMSYANQKEVKPDKSILPIGSYIIKRYKGKDYSVKVLEMGFDLNGQFFRTLSALAFHISGLKVSGYKFFNVSWRV